MRILLIFICVLQSTILLGNRSKIITPGVVTLVSTFNEVCILNADGTEYLKIFKDKTREIVVKYTTKIVEDVVFNDIKNQYPFYYTAFKTYNTHLPLISVRAFYPVYNIVSFDAIKTSSGYKIYINGEWKYLKASVFLEYSDWNNFLINNSYVEADKSNPVYLKYNKQSSIVSNDSNYSYKIKEVKNDWIRVECLKECEGCPPNKILKGWIRWRAGNQILINLYYSSC